MATDTTIAPALTPEEWAYERHEMNRGEFDRLYYMRRDGAGDSTFAVMAKANDELPDGDPRKITRADIERLGDARHALILMEDKQGSHAIRTLYQKLAALLPPE